MSTVITRVQQLSGDSTARDIRFRDGAVRFLFEDCDSGQSVNLEIATDVALIAANSRSVHPVLPVLLDLTDVLALEPGSGIYVPPSGFGKLMSATRQGAHLALGRRSSEWPLLFQLVGGGVKLACPIRDEDAVQITPC